MRTALRTSIVAAALAGALLVPAASSAFAGASASAGASATAYGTVSAGTPTPSPDRYAGEPVSIGKGLVAVLRNGAEGPEAWIRYVGPHWKPGDAYMVRVVGLVDRAHPSLSTHGLELRLAEAETAAPVLVVTDDGATTSYPLPKGTAGPVCGTEARTVAVGGSFFGEVSVSAAGPEVVVRTAGATTTEEWRRLDRTFPARPASDGIIARIVHPNGAAPVFEWKAQGVDTPLGPTRFPTLPKGCKPACPVTEDRPAAARPATAPGRAPATEAAPGPRATVAAAPAEAAPAPQATVAAQPVSLAAATGATLPEAAPVADGTGTSSATTLAGLGLAAAGPALLAAWSFRTRRRTHLPHPTSPAGHLGRCPAGLVGRPAGAGPGPQGRRGRPRRETGRGGPR
ncbi:hypothetical protein [Streptomyces sp. WAC06614]|uniref:hypothetical protein n=1 Tax=Streptomyces sp. WAC06614 TaxID=2487416 RepID=UPI000F7A0E34|nr:hypothetical protein [Streptomyces sp. WAC06614]RSS75617.1 hypothetical protein EF918_23740 [Streptomyces sp. WAC06614]